MKTRHYYLFATALFLAITSVLLWGCKKDDDPDPDPNNQDPPTYTDGQGEIGNIGGTVMIDDPTSPIDGAKIVIPEGALNENENIKITTAPDYIKVPGDTSALLIKFEPEGLLFNEPVEISIPNSYNNNNVSAFYYNPDSLIISQIPIIQRTSGLITATTNHFSYYYVSDNGFTVGMEMLNIEGKIGFRINDMGFNGDPGLDKIPSSKNNYANAFEALINADEVNSIFQVSLYKDGYFWNSRVATANIVLGRYSNDYDYKALVYKNNDLKYTSDFLGSEPNGLINTWFSGEPLIFYFEDYVPDQDDSYYVKLKWRLIKDLNINHWTKGYTSLYEVHNEDDDQKITEMGVFPINDVYETCLDESYISGTGTKPAVATYEATNIYCDGAQFNGEIINEGDAEVTQYGFCWSKSSDPDINDEHCNFVDPGGLIEFDYDYYGYMEPNHYYYVRAYAKNSHGISYGQNIEFATEQDEQEPEVRGHDPLNGETINGTVDIYLSVDDDCMMDKATFEVSDGGSYQLLGEDDEPVLATWYEFELEWNTELFDDGNYTIRTIAYDASGKSTTYTWDVVVDNNGGSNTPPTAAFSVNLSSGSTSTTFEFDGSDSYDNEDPTSQLQVRWDFDGDGSWDTGWDYDKTENHQYSDEGTYTAKMEVKDTEGLTDYTTHSVTVNNGGGGNGCDGQTSLTYGGQTYDLVEIGDQCWMAENLNYETGNSWCYDNNSSNCDTYGRLYDWSTALGACPSGWHLPSDDEWCTLTTYIDPTVDCDEVGWSGTDAGYKMKSTSGWYSNGNGSDAYGFAALPGGGRSSDGGFSYVEEGAYFWSSTEDGTDAWGRLLNYNDDEVGRYYSNQENGFSVRCLKD
ncbi:MAG: hypothetical protein K9H15_03920 [Bacteroidales bacterium]|nr:hypothetical protein [Bacteroidales bacterium]